MNLENGKRPSGAVIVATSAVLVGLAVYDLAGPGAGWPELPALRPWVAALLGLGVVLGLIAALRRKEPSPTGAAAEAADPGALRLQSRNRSLHQIRRRLELLNEVSTGISAGMEMDEIIVRTLARLAEDFGGHRVVFASYAKDGTQRAAHVSGTGPDSSDDMDVARAPDYLAALHRGRPVPIQDTAREPRLAPLKDLLGERGVAALLDVPLLHGEVLLGVLRFSSSEPRNWTENEVHTLTAIGDYLSLAIREAREQEERRELETRMLHAQKLESLGVLAGGIAHDFNNLLTGILGHTSLVLMDLDPDSPVARSLSKIETAAMRAAELTEQMLAYSGRGQFLQQRLDLSQLVRETSSLLEASISGNTELEYSLADDLPAVCGDPGQLRQIVMNLITNASEAMEESGGGAIRLVTGVRQAGARELSRSVVKDETVAAGDFVFVEVTDAGDGMSEETCARIFEPFFTTKFTGRGLGLAAVLGIVRGHHGAILVDSEEGRGTTFEILLPVAGADTSADAEPEVAVQPGEGGGCVLVIEDEPLIRSVTSAALSRSGFEVLVAADGPRGIDLFRNRFGSVDLVLLDMTMPHMGGQQVIQRLREIDPRVRVILSSGYSASEASERFASSDVTGFIQKPYRIQELLGEVTRCLSGERTVA